MDNIQGKKILFLITQSKYGGAQKYILQLARHFIKENEVLIAVGEKANQDSVFFKEARSLGIEPIIIDKLVRDVSLVKAFESAMDIRKLLVSTSPDILHLNSTMAGAIGSFAAWLKNFDPLGKSIRVIYTAHGFVFNEPLPAMRKKVYLIVEKITASWKGAIITVSEYDKQQGLKNKIAPDKRMRVIHNGIRTVQTFLPRDDARKTLALPAYPSYVIGTIASLYQTKGLIYLLQAASKLKEWNTRVRFIIIGDGPEKETLQKYINENKLDEIVTLYGSKENASSYLKAFDLFVLPSIKEGLSYTILEAGLAKLPVISTRVGGTPEIIENKKSGILVDPAKPDDLAYAIKNIKKDAQAASQYAASLQQKIQREFSLDAMISKTEKLYSDLYPKPSTK